jgi:TolB-like protein
MLDLLDDVVPRIVATVGDTQGILAHSMTQALRSRDPESFTPYEALLRSFGFHQHVSAAEHLAGRTALERAVKQAPDRAECWAMLSWLYRAEYTHSYNPQPDPMDRALAAAQRAVDLAPANQLAQAALASAFFFRRELGAFRNAAERALALNHMEGYSTAFLGMHFAYSGDWERGCALAERATQLNPHHPGWYWFPAALEAYRRRDGERALHYALQINMPSLWSAQVVLAVVNSQLGQMDEARTAIGALLALRPHFAEKAREELAIWWQPEMVEQMLGDLGKAGLGSPQASVASPASSGTILAQTSSGETRADEGFWVAVLPFKYSGSNENLKALAEGLSEEVITGLSRFSYLRVIGRGSTAKHSSESGDVRAIGKELGSRYVMEGSIRQAGSRLRLAVQLVDTVSSAHLWAENYERTFSPEAVFELQDDLVPRIVSTVADMNGVLPRSMSEGLRSRPPESLTPYEAVLRSFGYFERVTPEELDIASAAIDSALKKAPTYADAWAMLALLSAQRYAQGFTPSPDSLSTGAAAARKAVEAAPANHLAWFGLSEVLFFQKDFRAFRSAAERALALNPMDGNSMALHAEMLALSGEWDRGIALAARARQLNPHHPGWYWHVDFNHAYRQRDYRAAREIASRMNQTSNWGAWALTAAACGQLGDRDGAAKAIHELLKLRPDAVSRLRQDCVKWFDPEHAAHVMEGFRKAGLEP